jgi:hypothetical protein
MLLELAAAAKAHGPPPAPPIADKDLLSLLLTAEGLLFAALAVSVTLQTIAPGTYLPPSINKGRLAFGIFLAVGAVAVGTGATWWQLYAKGFPQDFFAPWPRRWPLRWRSSRSQSPPRHHVPRAKDPPEPSRTNPDGAQLGAPCARRDASRQDRRARSARTRRGVTRKRAADFDRRSPPSATTSASCARPA